MSLISLRRVIAVLFLFLFLIPVIQAGASPRFSVPLTEGWSFYYGDIALDFVQTSSGEIPWQPVSMPHTWNRVGYYNNDLVKNLHTKDNVNTEMGVAWYRQEFNQSAPNTGKVWLEFDAVSRVADVYLNGKYLGEHRGGFNRFRFNITQYLAKDGRNELLVKVDNTNPKPGTNTADTLPIAGDFFVHGGIYRPVRLVKTQSSHFSMNDYGASGVYAHTEALDSETAKIIVRSKVTAAEGPLVLKTTLVDNNGAVVAEASTDLMASDTSEREIHQELTVENPTLWQGTENPYLYSLQSLLLDKSGSVIDTIAQPFGIRTFAMDPTKGFILNGQPYRLRGASYHQDREGKGWAVSVDDIEQDITMLYEMGANTIRLAHYPHGQPVHEIANRLGIVLWDEIPLVTSWTYGKDYPKETEALAKNAELQLVEMIRQNYNHPSVVTWGISNEVDFGAIAPAFLGAVKGEDAPTPGALLQRLNALAKSEDGSRPTTQANCCDARPRLDPDKIPEVTRFADTAGANRYFGWYYGKPAELSNHLDHLQQLYPNIPMSVSEYGAGGAVSIHTDNPIGGPVDATGFNQPEEYMSYFHAQHWQILNSKPYLWASWVWNGFDFATKVRREGDAIDINTKGLITYDRSIKKDSYYFYKANWSAEPTVHITQKRYKDRAYPVTDVRVYSNADITTLKVNGRKMAAQTNCPQNICVWNNVRLRAGDNKVRAIGKFATRSVKDSAHWQLAKNKALSYRIDAGALLASQEGSEVYGSDAFFEGGEARSLDKPGSWGKKPVYAAVKNTNNRLLVVTYRAGDFSYTLPMEPGQYRVKFTFVKPEDFVDSSFDVIANGQILMDDFALGEERSVNKAVEFSSVIEVSSQQLILEFQPSTGEAMVSAITVEPAP